MFEAGGSISWNEKEDSVSPGFIFAATGCETVRPSFNPFLRCVVPCFVVILMIIFACISAPGLSVRLGCFRSCALSTALSLNQLFLQTNFTAVILIKRSACCDFLFNQSFANSVMCE